MEVWSSSSLSSSLHPGRPCRQHRKGPWKNGEPERRLRPNTTYVLTALVMRGPKNSRKRNLMGKKRASPIRIKRKTELNPSCILHTHEKPPSDRQENQLQSLAERTREPQVFFWLEYEVTNICGGWLAGSYDIGSYTRSRMDTTLFFWLASVSNTTHTYLLIISTLTVYMSIWHFLIQFES